MGFIDWLLGREIESNRPQKETEVLAIEKIDNKPVKPDNDWEVKKKAYGNPVPGRVSSRDEYSPINSMVDKWSFDLPDFAFEVIPLIRKLSIVNEDVGQVVFDIIQLCNTGHTVEFDKGVKPDQIDKMRRHLHNRSKLWTDGVAGVHGLINKLVHQILIAGALSNEWVINKDLTGIDNVFLVKPETIRWKYNKSKNRYEPYQVSTITNKPENSLIKLNPLTFKYYGLMGDTELPYGIPLYIPALKRVGDQKIMDQNISYILDQLGLLGFFEAKLEKPEQRKDENDEKYESRLNTLLTTTKKNLSESMRDGVTVGFIDDHEFEFHSTTKNLAGVGDLYNQTLKQVAKGLKHPASFLGISDGKGSDRDTSIVFTKMLSQLTNIQNLVKQNLEFGFGLELRLAGYDFDFLEVKFNESTITDKLKIEQAREIQLRNLSVLYNQGIISQDTYADEAGYEEPDEKEPRAPAIDPAGDQVKKEDREKDKDKSDRKVREKNDPQPKRKDQSTKPV
jgi:hypothetical protein